jgi:CspA family cold shock protein
VAIGIVKWFNPTKGGLFSQKAAARTFFVHITVAHKAGLDTLKEGAKVSYELVANRGKESADNLRIG